MTDRDRLIELIEEWYRKTPTHYLADHLLANGIIAPPCKVGDMVYYLNQRCHVHLLKHTVYEAVVVKLVVFKDDIYVVIKICDTDGVVEISQISDFGLNLFKTKEEAEKVVKEFFK